MMKTHYHPYFKSPPPPLTIFTKKVSSPPYRVSFENRHLPFTKVEWEEGVQTMDSYIETNIYPSILFSSPHFMGTFAIFPQGYFIMTHPVYENLEKHPTPPASSTPTTIKHKRV